MSDVLEERVQVEFLPPLAAAREPSSLALAGALPFPRDLVRVPFQYVGAPKAADRPRRYGQQVNGGLGERVGWRTGHTRDPLSDHAPLHPGRSVGLASRWGCG